MSKAPDAQVESLLKSIIEYTGKYKGTAAKSVQDDTLLLMIWLDHIRKNISNKHCDRLLDHIRCAVVESAGCISLGLVRPAIFSMRTQIELGAAWIYYNDHPIEWVDVEINIDRYPMRSFFMKYLNDLGGNFSDRMKILMKHRARSKEDLYGLLSVHVHSTSKFAAPIVNDLASLVQKNALCLECVQLQKDVAEYLFDLFSSWYADRWHDYPNEVKDAISQRLSRPQLRDFCK